ncbi:MAG TPA: DNA mismatch repair endonuclease MutL [Clostridiales bacterium]|nr:DNA mismatch repair endonuclease MutL [Clostridiales bacterium]
MSKINVLEPNVFNMISAGEVVERPSSVVKELIENSIDSGASEVSVYVEDGGIRKIQVSDNGIGIEKEDMRKAFLPHATSKLKNIVDLDSLSTLGFRGEALASISSVSEVTLSSKSKNQDIASKITLSGGKVTFEGDDSRAEGTVISVENLFFNTPARLKFLKKGVSELNYLKDVVRMLILANPSVRIELSNEEGTLLRNEGGTLSDAIFSVYGAKTADNLLEICDEYGGAIKVSGFTSKVDYTKTNRTYQTIIVNGRAVEDQTVQTAVEKAYSEYLMKRTYPMFVLDILMPFDDVDVNVHPSKTEVRFRDKHAVFSAVYHAVQNTINNSLKNVAFGFDVEQNPTENTQNATKQSDFSNNFDVEPVRKPQVNYAQSAIDTSKLFSGKTTPKNYFGFDIPSRNSDSVLNDTHVSFANDFTHSLNRLDGVESVACDDNGILTTEKENDDYAVFDGKIVGQIFDTYIICERGDLVYLIDQHAAHERILYDRIIDKFNVEHTQPLLIPFKLTMTGEESEYFERILPNLQNLGFEIGKSGSAYTINAVPEPVAQVNFSKFFSDLFANMQSESELTLQNLLKDKLCQQACKAAIKGGQSLSRAQIERVIKNYVDENGNLPTKCPHGRPAVVAFSAKDIEKLFKRIV